MKKVCETRLCIVGGGVTKDKAPFDDPDAVIWSTASVGLGLPRVDAVFEIHDGTFPADQLNAAACVIYMRETHEDIPRAERFPIERLFERFGKRFNGTVIMMLGWAAIMGFKNIELYGVDFSSDEEYARRNMFYWMMGHLSALGYKIKISPGGYMSDECATYMYEDDGLTYMRDLRKRMQEQAAQDAHDSSVLTERKIYAKAVLDTITQFERRY